MSMRAWSMSFGLALGMAAGCTSMRVDRLASGSPRPAVPADSVRLFFSPQYVPGRYEQVAVLGRDVNWLHDHEHRVYRLLKRKAGELGANGVIIAPRSTPERPDEIRVQALAIYIHPRGAPPER
jgi:hypothetical protein